MPSPFDSVAEIVSFLSNLQSLGSGLAAMFGASSGLDVQKLADMIVDEVKRVFMRDLTIDKIRDATAAEQAAVQYLNEDYANAVTAGDSDAALYALLVTGQGANYLTALETQINVMAQWTDTGEADLAQQTISLYLMLAVTILGYYQERARRSTGSDHDADVATIKSRAQDYHDKAAALFAAADTNRRGAVSGVGPISQPGMGSGFTCGAGFNDSWIPDDRAGQFVAWLRSNVWSYGTSDPVGTIVPVYDNYMTLLATGSKHTANAIQFLIQASNGFNPSYGVDEAITAGAAYGGWFAACGASLANLLRLEAAPLGSPAPPATGQLCVFARDTSKAASYITQSSASDSGWTDWTSLGGEIDQLGAIRNADGRVEVFARGMDQGLYHLWQESSSATWSAFTPLGGSIASFAVARGGGGALEVFALEANGALSHAWQAANTDYGWTGWSSLGGVSSAIAVGRNDDGRLEVFAIGADNALYHMWQIPSTTSGWSGWSSLGGWSDMLAVAQNPFGKLEVFARGSDKALYHIWQDASATGGWAQWSRLGNTIDLLSVGTNANGALEVFVRGTDQALYHIWQDAGASGGWSPWAPLGGTIDMLAVDRNASGSLEVFARGAGRALYHLWQEPSANGWSGWSGLGGTIDLLAVPTFVRPVSASGGADAHRTGALSNIAGTTYQPPL